MQPHLFDPCCGFPSGRQADLPGLDHPEESTDLACRECGGQLVRTVSGYWACGEGHGGLVAAFQE